MAIEFNELFPSQVPVPATVRTSVDELHDAISGLRSPLTVVKKGINARGVRGALVSRLAAPREAMVVDGEALMEEAIQNIRAAMQKAEAAHVDALQQAGVQPEVLALLRSWMDVKMSAELSRQPELLDLMGEAEAAGQQDTPVVTDKDPTQPLTAIEMGQALGGLGEDTVRVRERGGDLFAILRPGRKRGREYPAFQAWPGVTGAPLTQLLSVLGRSDGPAAYGFFTSPNDLLLGLTPIEALAGVLTLQRGLGSAANTFLAEPHAVRLQAVLAAAHAYVADQAA